MKLLLKQIFVPVVSISLTTILAISFNFASTNTDSNGKPLVEVANEVDDIDEQFAAVDNMHHFMEYISEPSYKALKQLMKKSEADRATRKQIKNHALVLTESTILVAQRGPVDDPSKNKQWKTISLDVYQAGKELYKSSGNLENARNTSER